MIVGEVANFVAYIYAPAVLVTPLGALSIIVRYFLKLFNNCFSRLADIFFTDACHESKKCCSCTLYFEGTAPTNGSSGMRFLYSGVRRDCSSRPWRTDSEFFTRSMGSGHWTRFLLFSCSVSISCASNRIIAYFFPLAAFLTYVAATLSIALVLILHFEPRYGQTNILVYLGICSLMGALTVFELWTDSVLTLAPCFTNYELYRVGCEHKGDRDCHQAHLGGGQSIQICTDLVFPYSCSSLCYHTVELFKQGSENFPWSSIFLFDHTY